MALCHEMLKIVEVNGVKIIRERRRGLNLETQAALEALMAEAWLQVIDLDQLANDLNRPPEPALPSNPSPDAAKGSNA